MIGPDSKKGKQATSFYKQKEAKKRLLPSAARFVRAGSSVAVQHPKSFVVPRAGRLFFKIERLPSLAI
jgi:hypothetical protein